MITTTNKRTVLCFDTFQNRKEGIDFLLGIGIAFTYSNSFPVIKVSPRNFIKHHLDLYLPGIIRTVSQFTYSKNVLKNLVK